MPATTPVRAVPRLRLLAAPALLALASVPLFARNPPPKFSIPLDPLVIQPSVDRFIATQPFTTVNFVDNHHLLVSYTVHRLMKRLPDEPPDDDDRLVEAVLLEIPSGKLLASTEWRFHDHARYLWDLGHGHFMLRVRGTFTTIAPLANLDHGHAFDERPFLKVVTRRVSLIQFSPEADFMVLETEPIPPPEPDPVRGSPMASFNAAISGSDQPQLHVRTSPPPDVQIMFYRLSPDAHDNARIVPRVAGGAVTRNLVIIPANSTSFISAMDQGHQAWAFDVNTYTGKVYQLPLFDSTCRPVSAFVSKAEFIVFGCRGGNDARRVGAFNLRGEEMWEKSFYDTSLRPTLVYAPAAGRFAIGRLIISSTLAGIRDVSPGQINGETVDVYQTASGNQLLHLDCNPVEPGSQNFAISPDGMTFAIRNNGAIDFYVMPELTKKEQAAVQVALASAPEEIEAPVRLDRGHTPPSGSTQAETTSPVPPQPTPNQTAQRPDPRPDSQPDQQATPQPPTAQASTDQPATPQPASSTDDPPTQTHRKPPTLYNAPGEQPPGERNTSQPQ